MSDHNEPTASDDADVRAAVWTTLHSQAELARNPSTPPKALTAILDDLRDVDAVLGGLTAIQVVLRTAVAENPSTPPETLAELAANEDWRIRSGVACNPAAPPEQLIDLLNDDNTEVRRYVTCNAAARLKTEAGYRTLTIPRRTDTQPELATKRLELALIQHVLDCKRLKQTAPRTLLLDGDTYARLATPPRAVAKAVADLLEFLDHAGAYAPVSECVDAAELLATLPKYRQTVAWALLGEHPSQPLRAVQSVARAAGQPPETYKPLPKTEHQFDS